MSEEELDAFVMQGQNPFESTRTLSDDELLATVPMTEENIELPASNLEFKYKDSLPEKIIGGVAGFGENMYNYAKSDPANFAYDWTPMSLIDLPHDISKMLNWNTGIKYLPTLRPFVSGIGSILKPETYQKKLDAMIANPEDFAE